MNITSSTFTNNYAKNGGAIYLSGNDNVRIINVQFSSNYATTKGSEVYNLFSNYLLYMENSTV
jgi:predicted outer membrane repeat protein